jgi:predicted nucleotidyltransferase
LLHDSSLVPAEAARKIALSIAAAVVQLFGTVLRVEKQQFSDRDFFFRI